MNYILFALCLFQFAVICFLCFYIVKFAKTIFNVEESIEVSLDIMDESYSKISDISQKPVFFDSVEIRQVINEIEKVRESILIVATSLTKISNDKEKNNQSEEKKEE